MKCDEQSTNRVLHIALPPLTEANSWAGGVARPSPSHPQQATEPSLFTSQVWAATALTVVTPCHSPIGLPLSQLSLSSQFAMSVAS